MKTLRYLLIVALISMTSVLSATNVAAQNLATCPEAQMQSTSVMPGSGSALPSAAADGAYVTGVEPGTYTPTGYTPSGRRKIGGNTSGGSGDREDPYPDPLGDAALPLALLALAYAINRVRKRVRA